MALQIVCTSCGSKVSVRNDIHLEEKLRCPVRFSHCTYCTPRSLRSMAQDHVPIQSVGCLWWRSSNLPRDDRGIGLAVGLKRQRRSNNCLKQLGQPSGTVHNLRLSWLMMGVIHSEADSLGPGNASSIAQHNADDNHRILATEHRAHQNSLLS